MNFKHNISYRNSDSPESTLNVKYKYKECTKSIELNDYYSPHGNKLINMNNNKSIKKSNILRQQHFNSYTNENMDFFRLDYLKECDRDNYHNKYLNNLTPINRNASFDKLNDDRTKIKYLDSLKKNFLLKKENNKKDFFKDNLFTSENIFNNNYYKKINNRYNNINIYTNNNNNKQYDKYNYSKDNNENNNNTKLYRNISIDEPNYSGAYLSNINDYSIKENQDINPYFKAKKNLNISKRNVLSKQSHLFCKDVINNDTPSLFYKIYDYNFNNNGFKKQNDIFSHYMQNIKKLGYLVRDVDSISYNLKGNITPPKKSNLKENYYSLSSKK